MKLHSLSQFGPTTRAVIVAGVLIWTFFTLFPLYWTMITSFKEITDVISGPKYFPWIDFTPSLHAWADVLMGRRGNFIGNLQSSTWIGLSAAVVATAFGTMAAYALARYQFRLALGVGLAFVAVAIGGYVLLSLAGLSRLAAVSISFVAAFAIAVGLSRVPMKGPILGNEDIVFWFVSQRMFPPIVAAFALFLIYSDIGKLGFRLIDTYLGLTLCYIAFSLPIVVWLMRDFFAALPQEIEEAAIVDDVPSWRIFVQIVLPMTLPGLAATFMITLAFVWNEYLFALFLTNTNWQTLPIIVVSQVSQRGDEWWALCTAALLAILPMIVVVWLLGRIMRSGLMIGGIK